ncbi:nose resistant to fluoxetine protein 6-like [Thrips palmi]|uniref:Nose resistant to fluoxetine protein 6-like n=1 Tax=Thrips palmi TaxID=161013 RepID=A0A6P8YSV5_THRPL|nr:nose resistant to fluoxetine protein 6-like [Thrips palmi]
MRRRKWKEEEARMKRREEERKRAEEERRKATEDVRKRRIEELRKKKRQEEEARRQKEDEEEREREAEQERLLEEERARKEAELRRVREEREKEEQRRLEEKVREERRRRAEEQQKEEERKREEERRRAVERQEEEEEEERKRQEAKQREERDREVERERSKKAEEDERKRKAEEKRKRKAEEEERERKRKLEEEEKERKRKAEEEERKRKIEEEERKRKSEEEEKERRRRAEEERKRKAEQDEKEKKRKLEEEEKERKRKLEENEKERKRKAEDEEKGRRRKVEEQEKQLKAEEDSKRRKQEEESRKKKETEEKSTVTEREEKTKKRSGDEAKGKVTAKEDDEDEEEDLTSWMSGFPEFFAPTADDDVKNEECRKQSRIFVQHLAKYKMWALNMYDATAKLPSGVLSGNAIQLGDFDECLGVDVRLRQRSAAASAASKGDEDGDDADVLARAASWFADLVRPVLEPVLGAKEDPGLVHIRGQYCLAGVDLELRRNDAALRTALDRSLAHSFLKGSLNDSAHFVPRFRTLGWGVCVPEACSPRDVELALRGAVTPAMQRLPPSFFLAGGGLAALLLLALVATIKDTGHEPDELGGLSGVVASFSLRRNWSTLTAQEDPGADDIRCIHGIRCVCSLLLYAAHKLVPLAALPFSNRRLLTVLAASPASLLLRGSLMYTDTFLMLSGTLAAFHLSKHLSRAGSLDWAGRLATRVIRLTPTLGLVTVAYAYVLEHIGTGPLWGQLVEENGRICREHMWRNLLYVHNLWPFEQMCAPHTHQLALDMQLSLLVPPLVWLLVKAWPLASPVIVVLVGGSTWLRQQAALQHNVSLLIYNGAKPADLYRAADVSYIQATHRASAYLAGVALGYLLHRVPRKLQVPKVLLALGWLASASLGGWAMFSQRHVARLDYRLDVADAARFNALAPLAWAAAMAWLIFACYTGHGGVLDRVLCARPLVLLSRISYAFYLVQFLVFFYNAGSVRSQREFSVTAALDLWELVLVLALATVVTLLVELPMQSVRSALGSSKRRQSLKWEPPSTPTTPSPHELAAAYYYNLSTDVYTSHAKKE